ncbi:MAG TPA: DNA-formamidopyrimidine glycosylase family protein [Blastocatellia bacterium]|nr:DNA-formamidopyrimidine glycosylase family protein [Blastocatellia bacterium]
MPELPEVETQLLYLRRTGLGRVIDKVTVLEPRIVKSPAPADADCGCAAGFAKALRGRKMVDAARRGKYLIVQLDNATSLILHFAMGGELVYHERPADRPLYTRIDFKLAGGGHLAFTCPRNICRVMVVRDINQIPHLGRMGPEPLGPEFTRRHLESVFKRSHRRQIKPLLMDQHNVAGIGNIYADEILFASRVRPRRLAGTLSRAECGRIFTAVRRVLGKALETASEPDFPRDYLVSRWERDAGCRRCKRPITRVTIAGRTAYYCPNCQS